MCYQTGITLQVNASLMSLLISFAMFGHFLQSAQDVAGEVDKYLSSIGGEQLICSRVNNLVQACFHTMQIPGKEQAG